MSEKYQAYLTSRPWSIRKNAVHDRARGPDGVSYCERCKWRKGKVVHHKTYARVYNEPLSDLILLCDICHAFQHGNESEINIEKVIDEAIEYCDTHVFEPPLTNYQRWALTCVLKDLENPAWRAKV